MFGFCHFVRIQIDSGFSHTCVLLSNHFKVVLLSGEFHTDMFFLPNICVFLRERATFNSFSVVVVKEQVPQQHKTIDFSTNSWLWNVLPWVLQITRIYLSFWILLLKKWYTILMSLLTKTKTKTSSMKDRAEQDCLTVQPL